MTAQKYRLPGRPSGLRYASVFSDKLSVEYPLSKDGNPKRRFSWRSALVLAVSLAIAGLAWSALSPTARMTASLTGAPVPEYRVGEKYMLRYHTYENGALQPITYESWTITEIGKDDYKAVNGNTVVRHAKNPFLPLFEVSSKEDETQLVPEYNVVHGPLDMIFPLKVGVGSKNKVTGMRKDDPRTWEYEFNCAVTREEKVSVEAGTFDTFQVECQEAGKNHYAEKSMNYAPAIHQIVRQERRIFRDGVLFKKRNYELVKYEL